MSATSATVTVSEPVKRTVPRPTPRNPKDDLTETWRTDKSKWGFNHHFLNLLNAHPTDLNREIPVHQKSDKVPYVPHFQHHKWIFFHGVWPLVVHQLITSLTGIKFTAWMAFGFYFVCFLANQIHELHLLRGLGHKYGFLDGDKHARDQVPDISLNTVINSLTLTVVGRVGMTVLLTYSADALPMGLTFWLPLEIGLYGVVLDFWFYWYHRAMHDVEFLWKFHRTHHLTKHPNPLLTLFADKEQEIFDIVIIPLLTYTTLRILGLPMGFADWWVCHEYVVNTEIWGHSGVRVFVTPATTATPLLKLFKGELVTEDHDLHHRKGWKKSHNYGKQTRMWDQIFGTCHERIEMGVENIDWSQPVELPLFSSVK